MSVFDIVGPVMIGPSSSHTAGAVRLGKMARGILGERPVAAVITLYGSFAKTYRGHGTDRALVAGVLGLSASDPQIKEAFDLAAQAQIQIDIHPVTQSEAHSNVSVCATDTNGAYKLPAGNLHPNTALIELTGESGRQVGVWGVSVGGGQIKICRINDYPVELTGEYHTLIAAYQDQPGMIAEVTRILAAVNVNIAFMRVVRRGLGDQALMIIESDQKTPEDTLMAIRALPAVESAMLVAAL
ncbi:MAG: serine dehydratase beta chain [Bacillota bacterium]|jgi:L-serine dehydratase